jgi:hypothetical protein
MPLQEQVRSEVDSYCKRDLPGNMQWHIDQFSFISNEELKKRLGRAFYSARYVYKLMEALSSQGDELHPFIKFQIMQYASIYEAVICYLLWERYKDHADVNSLQTHKALKPVNAMGSLTDIKYDGEQIITCVRRSAKTPKNSIAFKDKVDCAVRIGFVEEAYSDEIKKLYVLRNLAHIETEAEKQTEVEIEQARLGYRRMKPFLDKIAATIAEEDGTAGSS